MAKKIDDRVIQLAAIPENVERMMKHCFQNWQGGPDGSTVSELALVSIALTLQEIDKSLMAIVSVLRDR